MSGNHRALTALVLVMLLAAGCGRPQPTPVPPTATPVPTVQVSPPEMVLAEAGSFEMGSTNGYPDELPVHTVRITRPFYVAKYPVTYEEFDKFCDEILGRMRPEGRGPHRGQMPVSNVTWYDAVAYCNWLSDKEGLTPCYRGKGKVTRCDFSANGYRLPTEAEWEYAARGGHESQGFEYAGSNDPDAVAWYEANSGDKVQFVGLRQANELGLYDLSGNMFEWCWDWYGEHYYASSPVDDPLGPSGPPGTEPWEANRVRRSGTWREGAKNIRVACRSLDYASYVGDNSIRLVRTK